MSKKEVLTFVFLLCLVISCFVFAGTHDPWDGTKWDVTSPDIDQPHGNQYKELYDLRKGAALRMNKEHVTLATSSAGGEHKQGSAVAWHLATASIPALQPDATALATTDNGRLWHDITTDIFYVLDDYSDPTVDGGWIEMGSYLGSITINTNKFTVARATGNTLVAGTLTVTGESTFNNHVNLGAGDDLLGSTTSDINIGSGNFTVAGATGNTVAGGTLDVTGNIDPTTYETTNGGFLDEDAMGSDAANKVASQQSIKAYVDAQIAAYVTLSVYTNEDSNTDAMLNGQAYKAATAGYVSAFCELTTVAHALVGYVGATSDPAGAGTKIIQQTMETSTDSILGIFFAVAKDEYFEVTATSGTPTILWKSMGTLSKPVDQD